MQCRFAACRSNKTLRGCDVKKEIRKWLRLQGNAPIPNIDGVPSWLEGFKDPFKRQMENVRSGLDLLFRTEGRLRDKLKLR